MKKKSNGFSKTFPNSRIPVCYILEYLKAGLTKNDFHQSYPWIKKKDINTVINYFIKKHCNFGYSFS